MSGIVILIDANNPSLHRRLAEYAEKYIKRVAICTYDAMAARVLLEDNLLTDTLFDLTLDGVYHAKPTEVTRRLHLFRKCQKHDI